MDLPVQIVAWVVCGLVVGLLARLVIPPWGRFERAAPIGVGIVGAIVGGVIGYALGVGTSLLEPVGWILWLLGAVLALFGYYFVVGRRSA